MGKKIQSLSPDMDVSDDSNEYKREMRNQRMKDIGAAGAAIGMSGLMGKSAYELYKGRKGQKNPKVEKKAEGGTIKASKMGAVKQGKPSMGSASKRADGIAQRGKTKGRMV